MHRLLSHETFWNVFYQILVLVVIGGLFWYLLYNMFDNLERRQIASGYSYLSNEASFAIGESLIDYSPTDNYARAFLVGLLNTLRVALIGIVLATILGTFLGLMRLSSNWLLSKLTLIYIDVFRNIPLILQLFFWYSILTAILPSPRQAFNPLPSVYLSNRGLFFPVFETHPAWSAVALAFLACIVLVIVLFFVKKYYQEKTGKLIPFLLPSLVIFLVIPVSVYVYWGAPTAMNTPTLSGFNFQGGMALTPEFSALLFSLVLYTAAFIAEIVRSGIQGVPKGQTETGLSLGLRHGQVTSLIILPQALRIIIPPLTSQYLNLTKNSSLAVAIGYPDLVNILNTTINQTGQAVENVLLMMSVYLSISLAIALFMNWYNRSIALKER